MWRLLRSGRAKTVNITFYNAVKTIIQCLVKQVGELNTINKTYMFNILMCLKSLPQQVKMPKVQIMLLQQHEGYLFLIIIIIEYRKIYLVSEEISGFESPWYKYKNRLRHFYMYLFYRVCLLIALSILIFAPNIMVSEYWIIKNVLIPELRQKFWPLKNIWFCHLFLFIHMLYLFTFVKLTYA